MATPGINATVIDITNDNPQTSDLLFVDTNVWYWFAYPRVNLSMTLERQQIADKYLAYMNKVLGAQIALCVTGLTFNELASSIEGAERKIAGIPPRNKAFRYDHGRREVVVAQVRATWDIVVNAAHWLDIAVTQTTTDGTRDLWSDYPLDPTDALALHALESQGIRQVLTDDRDFAAVSGIAMFTADDEVIEAARSSGHLFSRS